MSLLRGLASAALFLILGACAGEYPQSSIDPKSDFGHSIQSLYSLVFWITMAILVVVWGALAYILVRYRDRPGAPRPRQIHGHLGLELAWTVVPAILVVVIAIPTIQTVFRTQQGAAEDDFVVEVTARQFWWEFRYPELGIVTANDLHLPIGRRVSLRLRSADVIHSFWVPMLGGKRDLNPPVAAPAAEAGSEGLGEVAEPSNWLHFTVLESGVYRGQCAEFCGPSHALMGVRVIAQNDADFAGWVEDWRGTPAAEAADSAAAPDADPQAGDTVGAAADADVVAAAGGAGGGGAARVELGRQTFHASACIACHAVQGTSAAGVLGPNLTLMGRRLTVAGWLENSPENLARWITAPGEIKPGAKMPGVAEPGGNFPPTNLSEEQVLAVAEYLWSLGRGTEGEAR